MLKIQKVTIKGFGPYVDQSIELNKRNGVFVIWGDNGFGKTTFINALKFGFFGEIPDEKNKDKSILNIVNVHNKNKGDFQFSVTIYFSIEDDDYILLRYAKPHILDLEPKRYNDFDIDFSLQKNGDLLPPREGKLSLERIMPKNTSRFFIFDGELLEEYNRLTNESELSYKIKDSIEQILGLPILTNGKRHVDQYYNNISNELLQLNRKKSRDEKNYKKLEKNIKLLENKIKEQNQINNDFKKFQIEYDEIQEEKKRGELGPLIEEYENLKKELQRLENEKDRTIKNIKEEINASWKGLTYKKLSMFKMEAREYIKEFESRLKKFESHNRSIDLFRLSITKGSCETCEKDLNIEERKLLESKINDLESKEVKIDESEKKKYNQYVLSIKTIDEKLDKYRSNQTRLDSLNDELDEIETKHYDTRERMKNIQKSIDDFDRKREENIILSDRSDEALDRLLLARQSLEDLDMEILEIKESNKKLEESIIDKISDESLKVYQDKEKILKDLSNLLSDGIDVFRRQLKERIQSDAEKLFLKFANQKDFVGLSINENYGLDILHSSGEIVPVKSSGYSHIVSLCLIGALHKNAPVQGPVFIDSPSGRLDHHHKNNLTKILTDISDQVVLLLYNGELDEQLIRKNLGSSLINEFNLIHVDDDAFRTEIKER